MEKDSVNSYVIGCGGHEEYGIPGDDNLTRSWSLRMLRTPLTPTKIIIHRKIIRVFDKLADLAREWLTEFNYYPNVVKLEEKADFVGPQIVIWCSQPVAKSALVELVTGWKYWMTMWECAE